MKTSKYLPLVIFGFLLIFHPYLLAKSRYTYALSAEADIYFGYISFSDVKNDGQDPVVIREGDEAPQVAVVNFPLLPGDTVRTTASRRCEIQFDTGTIIRLDVNTELKIETILAKSLSTRNKITNLLLNRGEVYIMYKRYSVPEIFQMVTANASVKMNHKTVALIRAGEEGSTAVHVKLGKADVLYGPDELRLQDVRLGKSESVTVSAGHKALRGKYEPAADFEQWNESMNKNFVELHKGTSVLPKPIRRYPEAVMYFAQKYSNSYGEWVWHDLYGYVWRPHYNDYFPWGDWRPYYYGFWRETNGQLFWVPMETWGWVPYHLGLWVWSEKYGWLWIPGSAFAPAWVAWDFHFGYYSWRPWHLYDWYWYGYMSYPYNYWYLHDYLSPYYTIEPGTPAEPGQKVMTRIRKDQLKKNPSIEKTIPRELREVCERSISAMLRGDKRALESLRRIQEKSVVVRKEDLNTRKVQEKAVSFQEISLQLKKGSDPSKSVIDPYRSAVRAFRRNAEEAPFREKAAQPKAERTSRELSLPVLGADIGLLVKASRDSEAASRQLRAPRQGEVPSLPPKLLRALSILGSDGPGMRFRDWNPDARVALAAGVTIRYSSKTNEVRCPEFNLSSMTRSGSRNLVGMAVSSSSGGSSGSSSGMSSSSGSSSSSRAGGQAASSRGSEGGSRSSGSHGSSRKD